MGIPAVVFSCLKNRLPASTTKNGSPLALVSSMSVAFRARPPRGFLCHPHGSISPDTFVVESI